MNALMDPNFEAQLHIRSKKKSKKTITTFSWFNKIKLFMIYSTILVSSAYFIYNHIQLNKVFDFVKDLLLTNAFF